MLRAPKRQLILSGFIVILLGLNLWYWWPYSDRENTVQSTDRLSANYRAEDFQIRMLSSGTRLERTASRDLFRPKYKKRKPKPKIAKKQGPPPKTAKQLAEEAARTELGTIKNVGIVFRDNRGQAFMEIGDQRYLVSVGDKVGNRFVVERITAEAVYVRDPQTQVSGQIPVAGK